ncbi:hypothetical protein DL764_008219 [Monosporascus ibericus]|uniref:MEI5 protein n=1 Tax=Monosporascus ibericus TaxID=155417 RepID=A0A4Q4SY41_9PEZI|nr:hypothetical protein DL764_008219 [Monosporascus ibericus]
MAPQVDYSQNLKTLFGLMDALTSEPSYKAIRQVHGENDSLKQQIETQSQEIKVLTRTVGRLQQSLDSETETLKGTSAQLAKLENVKKTLTGERDAEKAKVAEKEKRLQENAKAVSELQEKLKVSANSINNLKEIVKKKDNQQNEKSSLLSKVSTELEGKKAEMTTMSEKLKALSQYSCAMTTASDEVISKELGRVFTTVQNLAETFFSQSLHKDILGDDNLWKDIQEQIRWLPLPASNSSEAKQMRIAACIAALGSRFVRLIFVPVYQQSDTGELSGLLSSLAAADAPRETYLRSVLLDVLPDEQTSIRKQRTIEIVSAVCTGIGRLLEDQKKAAFRDSVERACKVADECWQKIRRLKMKVDPFMPLSESIEDGAEQFTDEFWLPVPLPSGLPTDKSPESSGKPSGTNGAPNGHELPAIELSDVKSFIWPAFMIGERIQTRGKKDNEEELNSEAAFFMRAVLKTGKALSIFKD